MDKIHISAMHSTEIKMPAGNGITCGVLLAAPTYLSLNKLVKSCDPSFLLQNTNQ
jgi:hypothetical protein